MLFLTPGPSSATNFCQKLRCSCTGSRADGCSVERGERGEHGGTRGGTRGRGDSGALRRGLPRSRRRASASVGRVWLREAGPGHTEGHLLISLLGDQGRLQPGENNRSRTPPQCECPGSQVSPRPRGVLCFRRLKAVFFLVRTTL